MVRQWFDKYLENGQKSCVCARAKFIIVAANYCAVCIVFYGILLVFAALLSIMSQSMVQKCARSGAK